MQMKISRLEYVDIMKELSVGSKVYITKKSSETVQKTNVAFIQMNKGDYAFIKMIIHLQ